MSHAFDARFSLVPIGLEEILRRLEPCLAESGVDFDGEIVRLHSRKGVPTVLSLATEHVSTLSAVHGCARSWWGVSLYCISRSLAEVLGRTDSIEVYIRIFEKTPGHWMVVYNESSGAFLARSRDESLANELAAFLARIGKAVGADFAVYDEEDDEARPPTLEEVEQRLSSLAQDSQPPGWLAIANAGRLTFDRAAQLSGAFKDRVRRSTLGFVVLPFLAA